MKKTALYDLKKFQKEIWSYYRAHGRHDMPWRKTASPYRIVVSEVMLQQTQVGRVTLKYKEFIKRFPNFSALAHAPLSDVLSAWQGLGYNRRALFLKKLAEVVVGKYKGKLPQDPEVFHTLPGIGKATAGSIAAFAFNHPSVFIETNIRRVFIHFFFPRSKKVSDDAIMRLVAEAVDRKNPREWYFALMDYGTMLAVQEKENPNRKSAHYVKQKPFTGSDRQVRGKIVVLLVKKKSLTVRAVAQQTHEPVERIEKIFAQLEKEGFVRCRGKTFYIVS
ncbi:MAG: A/G-specific adenine glycosylase [Candidatus Azambacteria bacterium]|nr:A/G-specific adenine glycosylase [Candidatus Azambacteria bacterium]